MITLTFHDSSGLHKLAFRTGRREPEEVVSDALNTYEYLLNRVKGVESLFIGPSKEEAVKLDITTFR